jgi:hypothetical protein
MDDISYKQLLLAVAVLAITYRVFYQWGKSRVGRKSDTHVQHQRLISHRHTMNTQQ